jgi:hypothetical protein
VDFWDLGGEIVVAINVMDEINERHVVIVWLHVAPQIHLNSMSLPVSASNSMGTASPQATDASQLPAVTDDPPFPDKISAYYSLVFPNFTYYLQTLTVTIGRRCIPTNNSASSSATNVAQVDVDLGPLKSVSRLHAKIEYEEEEERFVLIVIGRNGAWVDGVWSGSGSKVALSERFALHSSPYH